MDDWGTVVEADMKIVVFSIKLSVRVSVNFGCMIIGVRG